MGLVVDMWPVVGLRLVMFSCWEGGKSVVVHAMLLAGCVSGGLRGSPGGSSEARLQLDCNAMVEKWTVGDSSGSTSIFGWFFDNFLLGEECVVVEETITDV